MNWKLIFLLSLFGLAMAILTVYVVPTKIEPIFWLTIFLFCAYMIAKQCSSKYFLHGFLVSLANCAWITVIHVLLYHPYMLNHPEMAQMNANMPLQNHPRLLMLITGPLIGVGSGLVLGLFAFVAGKLISKKQ